MQLKHVLVWAIAFFGLHTAAMAATADLFSYDQAGVESQFNALEDLDTYLDVNTGTTYADLQSSGTANQFDLNWNQFNANAAFSFSDMDWGSFAWGFCCWPVGLFVVLLNGNKDSDQKMSFLIGIGVNIVLGVIGNFAR
ncbi:MAG: hypothetical protein HYZ16_00955 [Bacteroidetes bacterium]|jgi:hypothetical protein|nr:hypothetical protein [Bacteroidota bacterium]